MSTGRRTGIALAFAALLVALFAWLQLRGDGGLPESSRSPDAAGGTLPAAPRASVDRVPEPAAGASAISLAPAEESPGVAASPLEDERELRGRVIDATGVPVTGANVEARRETLAGAEHLDVTEDPLRTGALVAGATTDEDGAFAIPLPRARAHDLHVSAAGFATEVVPSRYAGQYVTVKLHAGAGVGGRVTRAEDGSPLAGAFVRVWRNTRAQRPQRRTETDDDGRFAIADLPPGGYTIEAAPETAVGSSWDRIVLEEGQVLEKDFSLSRGFPVSGRVTSAETGEPIEGAEVGEGWVFRRVVRTDADGSYVFPSYGGWGSYELHARAAGYGRAAWIGPAKPEGPLVADFALETARTVSGRVVDPAGTPVSGAYVAAFGSHFVDRDQKVDWLPTRSASDGTFEIVSVRPDIAHRLFVKLDGYGSVSLAFPGNESELESIDLGDVRLAPEATLSGVVVNEADEPIVGGEVYAHTEGPDGQARVAGGYAEPSPAITDEAGRFRVSGLAAGTYRVRCRVEGISFDNLSSGELVTIADGEAKSGVRIVVTVGLSISGTVVDPEGRPVGRAVVRIRAATTSKWQGPSGRTDESGTFTMSGLEPGTYSLTVSPWEALMSPDSARLSHAFVAGVDAGTRGLRVVVPLARRVSGVVLESTGEKSTRAVVQALAPDGSPLGSIMTDASGRFSIGFADGATVTLKAVATSVEPPQDGRGYDLLGDVTVTVTDVPSGAEDVVLELPPR